MVDLRAGLFQEKSMRFHLVSIAVLMSLMSLAGCMMNDSSMGKAENYAPQEVVFASPDLAGSIEIGKIERTFDSSGIMHLVVPLRATTDLGLTVDYRITYFDDSHNPVDVPTGWMTKSLTPGIREYIEANSANDKAKDFQVDFRWPVTVR